MATKQNLCKFFVCFYFILQYSYLFSLPNNDNHEMNKNDAENVVLMLLCVVSYLKHAQNTSLTLSERSSWMNSHIIFNGNINHTLLGIPFEFWSHTALPAGVFPFLAPLVQTLGLTVFAEEEADFFLQSVYEMVDERKKASSDRKVTRAACSSRTSELFVTSDLLKDDRPELRMCARELVADLCSLL